MGAQELVSAIFGATSDSRVRLAMLMGSKLESGWNTTAVGDNGQSHGPFQIFLKFHPSMTKAKAQDPVLATQYMLPSYRAGVSRVPDSLWQGDPAKAAATAAFYAERPKVMYPDSRVRGAWPDVQKASQGGQVGTGYVPGGPPVEGQPGQAGQIANPLDGIGRAIDRVGEWLGDIGNRIYYVMIYAAGGIMLAAGLYLLFRETTSAGDITTKTADAIVKVATLGQKSS